MAFPTGYTAYQDITIDNTKVAADLTDYTLLVDLADLVKAGADVFDTCRTDGGDLRATKSDGTTELPIEVVAIDTTAKTGEVHIKITGTTSSSTDTVIRLYYNGTDTAVAVGATYGRNAVWGNYEIVHHLNEYESTITNSTGNTGGTPFNLGSGDEVAGKIAGGLSLLNNDDYISTPSDSLNSFTLQLIFKKDGSSGVVQDGLIERTTGIGAYSKLQLIRLRSDGTVALQSRNGINAQEIEFLSTSTVVDNNWRFIHATLESGAQKIFIDGAQDASDTKTQSANSLSTNFFINSTYDSTARFPKAMYDEVRVRSSSLSANWITTEYNNQNDEATFWGTWTDAGGSPAAQVARRGAVMMM